MEKIKTNKTNSVNSVNKDSFVSVNINHTTKPFHFMDIKDTVDQYEVFKKEKDGCNKYRLIVTINPFCTNVLFNTLTEIIRNEGSVDTQEVLSDDKPLSLTKEKDILHGRYDVRRIDAIRNTEYSNDKIGFEYHVGFDFFNNPLIRNTSFKIVNKNKNKTSVNREIFNTIEDMMRYSDGEIVKFNKRNDINTTEKKEKHLYDSKDILDITDSINANLMEDNGWWGFINNSSIDNKLNDKDTLNIHKPLNNKKSCEFIDMYPDRTLFSFNPKYNKYQKRLEYNWNVCLTYPYKNYHGHPLTDGDGVNGIILYSVDYVIGKNGNNILLFKTYIKHGLSKNDNIYIYINGVRSSNQYRVGGIGDMNNNLKEFYFYVDDVNLLSEYGIDISDENAVKDTLKSYKNKIRYSRVANNIESIYYFRKFRKLPNFKSSKQELTEDIAKDEDLFRNFIEENAKIGGKFRLFNKEQYQLAFANTIYNDAATQITFTDSLNTSYIKDNLGRPLSELYITIVKNNKGHNEWYGDNVPTGSEDIEYSHCFGKLTSGVEMPYGEYRDKENDSIFYSDVRRINPSSPNLMDGNNGITIDDDDFFGDVVEFNPIECEEHILSDVCFRFNTAQREWSRDYSNWIGRFTYDEINSDDYDKDGFRATSYDSGIGNTNRFEGYFYKAHHKIGIKKLSDVRQASHYTLKVNKANCVVLYNKVFVQITTKLRHKLCPNDKVLFFNELTDEWYSTNVAYIVDDCNFVIDPNNIKGKNGSSLLGREVPQLELLNLLDNLDNNHMQLLRNNQYIPDYATQLNNKNIFLWRDVYNNDDTDDGQKTIFTNGHFYINKEINFYLQRQDPHGKNGLFNSEKFPNDIMGKTNKDSNYEYKDETYITC